MSEVSSVAMESEIDPAEEKEEGGVNGGRSNKIAPE
tara:strand:+ start:67 stop:174 length:108 start_codon:yes stop_codon:yes gene_type:complete